jgi:DNA-directed RNA polymerase specialized sigma24 family protein
MSTCTPSYTADQQALVDQLRVVTEEIGRAKAAVASLHETRRDLLVRAYGSGLDTVQLGRVIGTSTEAVRKSLQERGGLPRRKDTPTK